MISISSPISVVGNVVQEVNAYFNVKLTGTTPMIWDDTPPQQTEGDEYMTLAITPKSATNKLKIEVIVRLSHTAGQTNLIAALFKDAAAQALDTGWTRNEVANFPRTIILLWHMPAGTTSEIIFKVRAGGTTGATLTFGGVNDTRFFQGTLAGTITITETKAN